MTVIHIPLTAAAAQHSPTSPPPCQYWFGFQGFREMMKGIQTSQLFYFFINTSTNLVFDVRCKKTATGFGRNRP